MSTTREDCPDRAYSEDQKAQHATIELERLVDHLGLACVVDALARIASEKADHIRASYSDEPLARSWDKDAKTLGRVRIHN